MRRLATLLIPLALCGCPEPVDHERVAKISTDDPQEVAKAIRLELSDTKFDRRLIREGPALKDYDQYQDVGPEILWEVVGPYARLMEEMAKSGQNDSAAVMCKGILLCLRGYLDFPEKGETTGFYGDPAFATACDVIVMYRKASSSCPPGVFDDEWWASFEATNSMTDDIAQFNNRIAEIRGEAGGKADTQWLLHADWTRRLRWAGLDDDPAQYKAANPGMLPDPKSAD